MVLDKEYASAASQVTPSITDYINSGIVYGKSYHWHVKVKDNYGAWSNWANNAVNNNDHMDFRVEITSIPTSTPSATPTPTLPATPMPTPSVTPTPPGVGGGGAGGGTGTLSNSGLINDSSWTNTATLNLSGIMANDINALVQGQDGTIFAATARTEGAVYRTTDGGTSWSKSVLPYLWAGSLAIMPNGHIFATAANAHTWTDANLYKSLDGGINWTQTPEPAGFSGYPAPAPVLLAMSDGVLYVGHKTRLYKTVNEGESWEDIYTFPYSISSLMRGTDGTLYVGTGDNPPVGPGGYIYRGDFSANGITWTQTGDIKDSEGNRAVWVIAIAEGKDGALYAGTAIYPYKGTLFRSTNKGNTWQQVTGIPRGNSNRVTSIVVTSDGTLYVGLAETTGNLYRGRNVSTPQENWTRVWTGDGDWGVQALLVAREVRLYVGIGSGGAGQARILKSGFDATPSALSTQTISSCTIISIPGTYVLTQNILNSSASTCINITSSDVIFDGAGYTIDGTDAQNTSGVYVYNSASAIRNVTVKNLIVTDWTYGIYYYNAANGSITNNNALSNTWRGIYLFSSINNTLANNNASSNTWDGILLWLSSYNTLNNNSAGSNYHGIYFGYSNYNIVYNNNLVNNTVQAYDDSTLNSWYSAYPSGGNFWSDYTGTDANSDGIGDTPYNIRGGAGAQDRYPFMRQNGWSFVSLIPTPTPPVGGNAVSRYAGPDGIVQRGEAVQAVMDYFNGALTRQDAIQVVMAFFSGG